MTRRIGDGHFLLPDDREIKFQEVAGEPLTWEQVDYFEELTEAEKAKAELLKCDCEKVRIVKSYLARDIKPLEIHQKTGISRTAIDKYKKIVSGNYNKLQGNYNQNTVLSESVVSILLLFNNLGVQTTMPLFLILAPILVLAIGAYIKREWERVKSEQAEHKAEADKIYFILTQVADLSFRRYPIMCNSEEERKHFEMLLKHYNNRGREVHVIERKRNQSPMQHFNTKELFSKQFCSANRHQIREGKENLNEWWAKLEARNLLDYLYTPKRENWLVSKLFIMSLIDFYVKHPKPSSKDRARKKLAYDLMTEPEYPETNEWEDVR